MTHEGQRSVTWFSTITRPASHLLATIATFAVFIASVLLGTYVEGFRILFYGLAVVSLFVWYFTMIRIYNQVRNRRE